jgi:PAS domain S-box-containing protein
MEAQELAHIGIWDWDAKTDKVTWSNELYRIAGRDPKLPAPNYSDQSVLFSPQSWHLLQAAVEKTMQTGERYQVELELIHTTGIVKFVKAFGGIKTDQNGEITGLFGTLQDITERKQLENVQSFLLTCGYPGSDRNFFESLAQYLAKVLDSGYVCIDKLEGDGLTAQTVAIYNEGKFDPNISYTLKQTPCGEVVGQTICCFPENVCHLFPHDAALQELNAQSYIGTTLWSFDGKPIGLIAIIGQKPLENPVFAESVLKMVAIRAAGELERMMVEDELRSEKERAEESEERFRAYTEHSPIAIYTTDLNGDCIYANNQWLEIAGLTLEESLGKGWLKALHPDDKDSIGEKWYKSVQSKGSWFFEYRFITPNANRMIGYLGSNVDITERKQSEAITRDIIEKNPMSIQILDMEGFPLLSNTAHTKLFGVKPPMNYSVLKDHQLLEQGFGQFFEQIKNGEVVFFPDSYYNVHDVDPSFPDTPIWVKAIGFTLRDNNDNPEKFVLMHENVTQRKHAESLLIDIIDKNPISIQIVNKKGYTLHANPAFYKLFGTIPPPDFSIFDDLERKSPELEKIISRARSGEIVNLPDIYFNAHDEVAEAPDIPLWIRALIFPLNDSSGKPERFVIIHENITERKITEQVLIQKNTELDQARLKAEESDRLKSAFLANMSHEIRTPMNGILGFAELLKEPNLTGEELQKYIDVIEKSGKRMLNIINDIIDISKIESGSMKVDIKESNVNEQADYIYTFFYHEVESKGIKLSLRKALPAHAAVIKTDREKLYAILTNLVKNALKYTETGSIEFGYTVVETSHDLSSPVENITLERNHALSLRFYVTDTGIGIPLDRQGAIFERFVQADIADTQARQGAGLDLAISKAYVEMLGGNIWVESEEGKGSTFYFTLPYQTEMEKTTLLNEELPAYFSNNLNKKLKILIAEDDTTSEMLLNISIAGFGREILKAGTGQAAVEICRSNPDLDLILMDILMPVMSGYEATRQIRQFNKEVKIIAQTAFGLSGDKEKALESGCTDYISKPINKMELLMKIQSLFVKS